MTATPTGRRVSYENTLVATMFVAAGIVFFDRFGIAYAFPYIGPELGLTNAQLGLTMSGTAFAWAVSSLLFSVVSDRLGGRKKVIIVGSLVLFSVATGLVGLAQSFGQLLAVRMLIGFAEGPALPLIQAAVAAASSQHRRGRNLGIVIAGTALIGNALPPLAVGLLSDVIGWRQTFLITAVPGLIIALLVAVLMKEDRSAVAATERITWLSFRQVVTNRNVLLAIGGAISLIGLTVTLGSFAPLFLAQSGGVGPGLAATILTLFGLSGACGNIVMASFSDRVGRKPSFLVAALCSVLVPILFIIGSHSLALLLLVVVLGFASGGAAAIMMYVIPGESVTPALAATTFAILIAVGEVVGGAGGPAVGGILADRFGLDAALWFCAGLAAVALVLGLFLRETAPRLRETAPRVGRDGHPSVADALPHSTAAPADLKI